eukprot:CAMPEP_0117061720 /NCGR_PEP_ID=MMETSP0472-20121206/42970_1 /TAXON_ID=693140 ORGANISM="Tiarina fusus, Strain LIS" /NCGR_SAMPLE_ID=MMETSP0472 /ASSEMBLY_ACC=CAM_ASM_000603 /LENGTH=133 /DNA_ID=CAMNT_0004780511 /DNA_START=387 /DNA_END=788 /DNA_ORIENTATION=+
MNHLSLTSKSEKLMKEEIENIEEEGEEDVDIEEVIEEAMEMTTGEKINLIEEKTNLIEEKTNLIEEKTNLIEEKNIVEIMTMTTTEITPTQEEEVLEVVEIEEDIEVDHQEEVEEEVTEVKGVNTSKKSEKCF